MEKESPFIIRWGTGNDEFLRDYFKSDKERIRKSMKQLEHRRAIGRYKPEEAAEKLEIEAGVPADEILRKITTAISIGALPAFEPESEMRYHPSTLKEFYEEVQAKDLNKWLEKHKEILGIGYRFPEPTTQGEMDNASRATTNESNNEHVIATAETEDYCLARKTGIPGKQPKVAIGKLAVKAAWQIECETERIASAHDVMTCLQMWADEGREAAVLCKSVERKHAVLWITHECKEKTYDLKACGKTLSIWKKSRSFSPE